MRRIAQLVMLHSYIQSCNSFMEKGHEVMPHIRS
jgi:hypothetical protein